MQVITQGGVLALHVCKDLSLIDDSDSKNEKHRMGRTVMTQMGCTVLTQSVLQDYAEEPYGPVSYPSRTLM